MKKKTTAKKKPIAVKTSMTRAGKLGAVSKPKATAKQQTKPAMLTKIKHVFVDSAMAFKALMGGKNGTSVENEPHKRQSDR